MDCPDEAAYRHEIRAWLSEHTPAGWRDELQRSSERDVVEFYRSWARRLHAAGHLVPNWPVAFGGRGLGFGGQLVAQQEMSRVDAPRPRPLAISLGHAAATLMAHGSPAQRDLLIPDILDGAIFCQGFSEPDAGSDLAAVRTRAEEHSGQFVINGQKTWSSFARYASWCLLLARTDSSADRHDGLSLLVVDMSAPGITVRPIRQATGSSEFCEVFFDDVQAPTAMLVGERGQGWRLARTTLATERAAQMTELIEGLRRALTDLAQRAEQTPGRRHEEMLADDQAFRREWAELGIAIDVLAALTERSIMASRDAQGQYGALGATASVLKVSFSELLRRLTRLATEVGGTTALLATGEPREVGYLSGNAFVDYIRSWTWTIAAGTNEIQRNVIAERILGLPREQLR
jgi:alkylation response protein AidB-like acyl-CoA dehydrogenase